MSFSLQGGFLTTGPPGKSPDDFTSSTTVPPMVTCWGVGVRSSVCEVQGDMVQPTTDGRIFQEGGAVVGRAFPSEGIAGA